MESTYSKLDVFRGVSVGAVVLLSLILLAMLPLPGYRVSRLVLFVIIIGFGVIGAVGAIWKRFLPTIAGAIGLFLLGFWQFTIGLFMLPTSAILLLTALLINEEGAEESVPDTA